MKRIDLILQKHEVKIGDTCGTIEPNITEDCIFYENDIPIGFYIKDISKYSEKASKLADLADKELRSKNVPKTTMARRTGDGIDEKTGKFKYKNEVLQYSTILGSIPPKPHMSRPYAQISSVHQVKSAQTFIKAMLMLALESEKIIKELLSK